MNISLLILTSKCNLNYKVKCFLRDCVCSPFCNACLNFRMLCWFEFFLACVRLCTRPGEKIQIRLACENSYFALTFLYKFLFWSSGEGGAVYTESVKHGYFYGFSVLYDSHPPTLILRHCVSQLRLRRCAVTAFLLLRHCVPLLPCLSEFPYAVLVFFVRWDDKMLPLLKAAWRATFL